MIRKPTLMLGAVAVVAFAVPAMASAAVPTLQNEAGTPVPVGTPLIKTGSNVTLTSSTLGEIKCKKLTINGTISVNDMTNGVTGSNSGQANPPVEECKNGTNEVKVTNIKLTDLKSSEGGVALATFTAEVDVGASVRCTFTGTNVKGTYANGGFVLTFSSATGITSSPAACGTAKLDAQFTLETTGGAKLKGVY